jgi:hypothetical protein
MGGQLLLNFKPQLTGTLYPALSKAVISVLPRDLKGVYVLRTASSLFGSNAPKKLFRVSEGQVIPIEPEEPQAQSDEFGNRVFLDSAYEKITSSSENERSYAVIDSPDNGEVNSFVIAEAKIGPRTAYSISGKTTEVLLDRVWRPNNSTAGANINGTFETIRRTRVYAESERLALAEQPIGDDLFGDRIELGALYDSLKTGRWIIVSGERADIAGLSGVKTSELAMIAGVDQDASDGDAYHTTITLAGRNQEGRPGLQYRYRRDTVSIYGNVVKATHGETRREVLGGGDAAKPRQAFTLKQPPLTYVSAANADGIESTLRVRVNDVEWKETDTFAAAGPGDRSFITKTDDDSNTTVIFGNGEQGARPPTGAENISAVYRNGLGKPGNIKPEQISLLITKPLGVKEVINPLRASGGADKERRDQARRNVPIALLALDRLVSTVDYANFARTFGGVGKAAAVKLSDGHRHVVHLTLAGVDDIPLDENSDLYRNLRSALAKNGDPMQPVRLEMRELKSLIVSANVRIAPEYLWEKVEPAIRAAMLDFFSFERRELGQSVYLSEVIAVIQRVKGVVYVDIDVLNSISETDLSDAEKLKAKLDELRMASAYPNPACVRAELAREVRDDENAVTIRPAQLVFFTPDVPDTLILNRIEEVKR